MGNIGMVGALGWSSIDSQDVIDLTQCFNLLSRDCGYYFSDGKNMPKHLKHLMDSIDLIRNANDDLEPDPIAGARPDLPASIAIPDDMLYHSMGYHELITTWFNISRKIKTGHKTPFYLQHLSDSIELYIKYKQNDAQ